MASWIIMTVMVVQMPLLMVGIGFWFSKIKPTEEPTWALGYRTPMSTKNKDTWAFAHHYYGRLCKVAGLILLPVSVVAMLCVIGQDDDFVAIFGAVILCVALVAFIVPIIPTERALKRTFDEYGYRRRRYESVTADNDEESNDDADS
jgi:uncharacterized membrane protein